MRSRLGKPLVVVLASVCLLFVPALLNSIGLLPSSELIRAAELAIAMLGIFLAARYELQNLELKLREERQKEIRQQKLNVLGYIESWLKDLDSTMEDITVLRELSEKDKSDGALIVPHGKTKTIEENLLRLETRGYAVAAKLADIDDKDLVLKVALVWATLDTARKSLSESKLPGTHPFTTNIADALRAIDKARFAALEHR